VNRYMERLSDIMMGEAQVVAVLIPMICTCAKQDARKVAMNFKSFIMTAVTVP